MDSFIDELPEAELHLHLVGSASVPTVLELARRHPAGNGVPPGSGVSPGSEVPRTEPELRAFFEFRDFPHFAEVYGAVSALIREPADVATLVTGAARDLASQNVRYAELTVTPYTFTSAGMPARELTSALDIAAGVAGREHGVRIGYIFDIASELGADAARATLDHALAHPLPRLLAEGLFVTLNSDDPPMFGTTLTQEYRQAASVLGLSRDQLADLARNSVRASFLDAAAKQALIDEIDQVAAGRA